MTKLKLVFWIILLLVFTVISGFLTLLVDQPLTPRDEYILLAIFGSVAVLLVVGVLALATFFIFRKSILEVRLKRSFQVYAFFCLAFIGVAYFKFPEAMHKRRNYEFIDRQDETLHALLEEKVAFEADEMSVTLNDEQKEEIADFVFYSIQFNNKLVDRLFEAENLREFIITDSEVTEETKLTIDWKLNTTK